MINADTVNAMADNDDLDLRFQLRELGVKRREIEDARSQVFVELGDVVRRAHAAGVSISAIAKDAQISRPKVYDYLSST